MGLVVRGWTTVTWAVLALLAVLGLVALRAWSSQRPRTDRDWAADQAVPARIDIDGDRVRIRNLRDFRHGPAGSFEEAYAELVFDAADVRATWFVLAPFANRWRGLAHTFLSFELTGDRFVAVSMEARREAHETYSVVGGIMRRFELTYVVGTEADLLGLRALRGDELYLYPARATREQSRALLLDVLARAERVRGAPEFYNTVTNNCATNVRDHVNRIADVLPYGWGMLFPGYSDGLALERGLIDTDLPLDTARARFRVDRYAREALQGERASFSRLTRQGLRVGS